MRGGISRQRGWPPGLDCPSDPEMDQGSPTLAAIAGKHPQTAQAWMQMTLQSEWQCLQQVVEGVADTFTPIEEAIEREFPQALFDLPQEEVSSLQPLPSLSVRCAGLGLPVPTNSAGWRCDTSKACTQLLVDSLLSGEALDLHQHLQEAGSQRRAVTAERQKEEEEEEILSPSAQRHLDCMKETGMWSSTMPNLLNGGVSRLCPPAVRSGACAPPLSL